MYTGDGPNCAAKSALPPAADEFVLSPPKFRLLGAGGKLIAIHGTLALSVRVVSHIVNSLFLVCDTFQIYYIICTEYIDRYVRKISVLEIYVDLMDDRETPNPQGSCL